MYSASSRTRLRCATAFRKSALISASQPVQPGTNTTLRDHEYGLLYHAICLFTLPAFAGYSFQPATEGGRVLISACHRGRPGTHFSLPQRAGSGSVGLSAWFCAEVKGKGKGAYSSSCNSPQNYGTPLVNGITQCYLPPHRGNRPAFTPTGQVGTRFIDPVRMKG